MMKLAAFLGQVALAKEIFNFNELTWLNKGNE